MSGQKQSLSDVALAALAVLDTKNTSAAGTLLRPPNPAYESSDPRINGQHLTRSGGIISSNGKEHDTLADTESSPRSSVPRVNDIVSGSASSIASKRSYQFADEPHKEDLAGLGRPKMVSTVDAISTSVPDQLTGNPLHDESSRASIQLPRNGQRPLKPNVPRQIIGTESSAPFPQLGVSCHETLRPLLDRLSPHAKPSTLNSGVREPIIPSTSHRVINPTRLFPVMRASPFQPILPAGGAANSQVTSSNTIPLTTSIIRGEYALNKMRSNQSTEIQSSHLYSQSVGLKSKLGGKGTHSSAYDDLWKRYLTFITRQMRASGFQSLSHVENLRFNLASEASGNKDAFYLTIHQLFCLRSYEGGKRRVDRHMACSPSSIDKTFHILKEALGSNRAVKDANLRWFSRFPDSKLLASPPPPRSTPIRETLIESLARFIVHMSEHWPRLLHRCHVRQCPLLVDELVHILSCTSATLQSKLFELSLRHLDVPGSLESDEISDMFKNDTRKGKVHDYKHKRLSLDSRIASIEQVNMEKIVAYQRAVKKLRRPSPVVIVIDD